MESGGRVKNEPGAIIENIVVILVLEFCFAIVCGAIIAAAKRLERRGTARLKHRKIRWNLAAGSCPRKTWPIMIEIKHPGGPAE